MALNDIYKKCVSLINIGKFQYEFGNTHKRLLRELHKIKELNLEEDIEWLVDTSSRDIHKEFIKNPSNSLILYLADIVDEKPRGEFIGCCDFISDRLSPIDIDIDVSGIQRNKVVDYIKSKMQAYPILAVNTLSNKVAIKDLGKALGFPYSMMDSITKSIEKGEDSNVINAVKSKYPNFFDETKQLEGAIRHSSKHASGLVIFNGTPEDNYIAMRKVPREHEIMADYDMKAIESIGLMKVDILGSITTDVIDYACKLANITLPGIEELIYDNDLLYEFSSGNVNGIFQAEGHTNKYVFQKVKPETFQEIADCISLARPGTKEQLPAYCNRTPEIDDELIIKLLEDTRGILLYQEQVLKIVQQIGNFNPHDSESLRSAITKKKDESVVQPYKERFIENAKEKIGELAEPLWDLIVKHTGYSFNKSHAVAYAVQAMREMYLKINYPVAFWASMIEFCTEEERYEYRNEIAKDGVNILLPSILRPVTKTCIYNNKIQLSTKTIKGIGDINLNQVIPSEITLNNALKFLKEVQKSKLILLAKVGFFDEIDEDRNNILNLVEKQGQLSLLDFEETNKNQINKYQIEKELFGCWITEHPCKNIDVNTKIVDVYRYSDYTAVGVVDKFKIIKDSKNQDMAFLTISDDTYFLNCVIFHLTFSKIENLPYEGQIVYITGRMNNGSFIVNGVTTC